MRADRSEDSSNASREDYGGFANSQHEKNLSNHRPLQSVSTHDSPGRFASIQSSHQVVPVRKISSHYHDNHSHNYSDSQNAATNNSHYGSNKFSNSNNRKSFSSSHQDSFPLTQHGVGQHNSSLASSHHNASRATPIPMRQDSVQGVANVYSSSNLNSSGASGAYVPSTATANEFSTQNPVIHDPRVLQNSGYHQTMHHTTSHIARRPSIPTQHIMSGTHQAGHPSFLHHPAVHRNVTGPIKTTTETVLPDGQIAYTTTVTTVTPSTSASILSSSPREMVGPGMTTHSRPMSSLRQRSFPAVHATRVVQPATYSHVVHRSMTPSRTYFSSPVVTTTSYAPPVMYSHPVTTSYSSPMSFLSYSSSPVSYTEIRSITPPRTTQTTYHSSYHPTVLGPYSGSAYTIHH